jgi:lysophospholipase L1-like esterase
MAIKIKNNATTTTATAVTSISTSIAVASGTGTLFPVLPFGDYFYATLVDANGNYEIVKVTARATDVMTIVRAQEGTIAIPFGTGSIFECRITAQSVLDAASSIFTAENVSIARIKEAILNTPPTGPSIASSSTLSVTRNTANNPTPNSASISLVTSKYAHATAMIKAGRLWCRFASGLDRTASNAYNAFLWSQPSANAAGNGTGFPYYAPPVHFIHDGQYFEWNAGGGNQSFSLMVNNQFAYTKVIGKSMTNGVEGATNLNDGQQNCWVKVDFGSRATRKVSLYPYSVSLQNFALADAKDSVQGWDRSGDPWAVVMADSFGQSSTQYWMNNGLYREALHRLGIFDVLTNAVGATGYHPNLQQPAEANCGRGRIADMALFQNPDLALIALGVNDNVNSPDAMYATAAIAEATFTSAVTSTLTQARLNGPNSLLVVLAPWVPSQGNSNWSNTVQGPGWLIKSTHIFAELQKISGPWIYVDPFTDYVTTSSGYTYGPFGTYVGSVAGANPSGANWSTGTGTTASPTGNGNSDLYTDDNTHPNLAGGTYLGERLAMVLRQAIFSF